MSPTTLSTMPPNQPSSADSADLLTTLFALIGGAELLRVLDTGMPHALKERLLLAFFDTADCMRNKPD